MGDIVADFAMEIQLFLLLAGKNADGEKSANTYLWIKSVSLFLQISLNVL